MAHELVLQFRGLAVEDRDELVEVEDAIAEILGADEELDPHRITATLREIRITTADAGATFARIRPFLAKAGLLRDMVAAARTPPDHDYVVLWPEGARDDFVRG